MGITSAPVSELGSTIHYRQVVYATHAVPILYRGTSSCSPLCVQPVPRTHAGVPSPGEGSQSPHPSIWLCPKAATPQGLPSFHVSPAPSGTGPTRGPLLASFFRKRGALEAGPPSAERASTPTSNADTAQGAHHPRPCTDPRSRHAAGLGSRGPSSPGQCRPLWAVRAWASPPAAKAASVSPTVKRTPGAPARRQPL